MKNMLKLESRKDEIIAMYEKGMNPYAISKEIGEYEQSVANLLRRYSHLPKRVPYLIDESYFEKIDSVDKAYFFGLIAADGSMVENGNNHQMTISLQSEDKYILELLRTSMKAEVPVREYAQSYQRKDDYIYTQSRFVTGNKKICSDLIAHGIIPRKSKTLGALLQEVEESYKIDFVRGYFDGNGSIFKSITSGTQEKNYITFRGTEEILSDIKNYLEIGNTKIYFGKGSAEGTGTYTWRFGAKKDIIKFKQAIYHENVGDFYLTRKKEKFLW